jgi:hypothetical protein
MILVPNQRAGCPQPALWLQIENLQLPPFRRTRVSGAPFTASDAPFDALAYLLLDRPEQRSPEAGTPLIVCSRISQSPPIFPSDERLCARVQRAIAPGTKSRWPRAFLADHPLRLREPA